MKRNLITLNLTISFIFFGFLPSCVSSTTKGHLQGTIANVEFISIPAGRFIMGADIDPKYINAGKEEGWRSIFIQDEFPQRRIRISEPFEM